MRRPCPRFTLLGLMAIVATMAVGFEVGVGAMRSSRRAQKKSGSQSSDVTPSPVGTGRRIRTGPDLL